MKRYVRILVVIIGLFASAFAYADKEQTSFSAKEVVSKFYEYLRAGDIGSMDPLFFRIPAMEDSRADWLMLIQRVSQKVEDEQLDWEVVCGKESSDMAAVIVNQTMKHGKKHADPDAIYLIMNGGRWLLLPDTIAVNAKDTVSASLSAEQLSNRSSLKRWAIGEIRGMTTECR